MGFLAALISNFQAQMSRNHNRPFLKGVMAACALVAIADRKVTFSQRMRVDQILETLDALKVFDPHEGIDLFNEFVDAIVESPKTGRNKAIKAIEEVAIDNETKELLLRICLAVSEANGDKHLEDQIEIVSLCTRLEIDPGNYGLYVDKSAEEFLSDG